MTKLYTREQVVDLLVWAACEDEDRVSEAIDEIEPVSCKTCKHWEHIPKDALNVGESGKCDRLSRYYCENDMVWVETLQPCDVKHIETDAYFACNQWEGKG